MNIYSHGQVFKAYCCTVCRALDSDPELLAKHEAMHRFMPMIVGSAWKKTLKPKGGYHKHKGQHRKRGIHAA